MAIHLQGSFVLTQEDCMGKPTQAIASLKWLPSYLSIIILPMNTE